MTLNSLGLGKRLNERWDDTTKPKAVNGCITALGSSVTRYAVRTISGLPLSNVSGPAGLNIGTSVALSAPPGANRQYVILGQSGGSGTPSPKNVRA